jgi:hypothetical protein
MQKVEQSPGGHNADITDVDDIVDFPKVAKPMRRGLLYLVLALAPWGLGCHADGCKPMPAESGRLNLAPVERALPSPDVSAVVGVAFQQPVTQADYYRLTAEECRKTACQRAATAKLLLAATETDHKHLSHKREAVDTLRRNLAQELALEARNRTTAAALELYYKLQEAELLQDLLTRTLQELNAILAGAKALTNNGYAELPETLTLKKTEIDLRAEQVKLQAGIRQLNTELKSLLGLEDLAGQLLPIDRVEVSAGELSVPQAVARALATRGDYRGLQVLEAGLDKQTLDAVRQAIAGLLPPLGALTAATNTLAPGLRVLLPFLEKPDVEGVRKQLRIALAEREREITKEVTTAIDDYRTQRERLAVSRERVAFFTARIQALEPKRANGLPVEGELRQANLDRLQAEREQLKDAYAWKQADITIRKAMGILCCE